ncbi:unnamed protein product, partial [marine sediment metagenome]
MTFTIDDNFLTTLTDWKPLFDVKGINGCAALLIDAMEGRPPLVDNLTEWLALQADGWEIANHGVTHDDLRTLTEAQLE